MLVSPSLMERGRSRSREPVPQLMRAGSAGRGRSVSVESRRSRCSSEGSVAEFEELAKPLNSRQDKTCCLSKYMLARLNVTSVTSSNKLQRGLHFYCIFFQLAYNIGQDFLYNIIFKI